MPRHRRLEVPGAIYHVITRGIERRDLFKDTHDREEFLRRLAEGLRSTGDKCFGWVLMPNHFHLVIRTGIKPLSDLMRKLLTGYAIYFNRRYKRTGYLYQNRYKSILCQEEAYLLELVRYVHLNPLRAGIVKDLGELKKYKWSGHVMLAGERQNGWQSVEEVLGCFGSRHKEAVEKYLIFVRDGMTMGRREDLTGGGLRRSAGGWRGVHELKRTKEYWRSDERILGDGNFVEQVLKQSYENIVERERLKREGWNLEKVIQKICVTESVDPEDLLKKGRSNQISRAKQVIMYLGCRELGLSGSELSRYFKITKQAVSKAIKLGEEVVRTENIKWSS